MKRSDILTICGCASVIGGGVAIDFKMIGLAIALLVVGAGLLWMYLGEE